MKSLADKAQAFLAGEARQGTPASVAFIKVRTRLRGARRFTLSPEFLEVATRAANAPPDVIMKRALLACNLPFPTGTWIEWDQNHRLALSRELGTLGGEIEDINDDRGYEGFLLYEDAPHRWTGMGFWAGREALADASMLFIAPMLSPIVPFTPMSFSLTGTGKESEFHQFWDRSVFESGWGYRRNPEVDAEDPEFEELMQSLARIGSSVPEYEIVLPALERASKSQKGQRGDDAMVDALKVLITHAQETRGDLRFLITVLAMLNSVPTKYVHASASGRFTRRLNSMDYLDTHVVHLDVRHTHVVRIMDRAARGASSRHRRHEVRGFWRVAERGKGRQGCAHLPVDGDGKHCSCGRCGSRLVWVDGHLRGDASIGFVRKDYEVH